MKVVAFQITGNSTQTLVESNRKEKNQTSVLLRLYKGNPLVTGRFPSKGQQCGKPFTRGHDKQTYDTAWCSMQCFP